MQGIMQWNELHSEMNYNMQWITHFNELYNAMDYAMQLIKHCNAMTIWLFDFAIT